MKHASTRDLFAHWDERRGERPAPERADIDPAAIRHALSDTFTLAVDFVDEHRFRLAGTRVCALFCRELKGESFAGLWSASSRPRIHDLLRVVNEESIGVVAGVTGRTSDDMDVDLELLLLPLAFQGHARIRTLGALVPTQVPFWLGEKTVTDLELGLLRHVGPAVQQTVAPRLVPASDGMRIRHGFTVHDGGRAVPPTEKTG